MDAILFWPPLIWMGRVLGVLVLGGVIVVALALVLRVLHPSNLRALAHGDLPAIRRTRFTVMGQEIEVSTVAETSRDEEIVELRREANLAKERVDKLAMMLDALVAKELARESQRRDERERHGPEGPPRHVQE